MEIIKFNRKYIKDISRLMLKDLKNPPKEFPKKTIIKFIEHAKEKGIIKEFENPNLIGFLAIDTKKVLGFIVGYKESSKHSTIDYITGNNKNTKKLLLDKFIQYYKDKKMRYIKTDSFKFMDNHDFFEENNFKIIGKEKIENNLIMFWRKKDLTELI